jgi:hypothetical protein
MMSVSGTITSDDMRRIGVEEPTWGLAHTPPKVVCIQGKMLFNLFIVVHVSATGLTIDYDEELRVSPTPSWVKALWVQCPDDIMALEEHLIPNLDVTYPSGMDAFDLLPRALLLLVAHGMLVGYSLSQSIRVDGFFKPCWCFPGVSHNIMHGLTCQ